MVILIFGLEWFKEIYFWVNLENNLIKNETIGSNQDIHGDGYIRTYELD